jgi:hypothetical protein
MRYFFFAVVFLVAFFVPHFFPHAISNHLLALIFFTTNRSWFGIFILKNRFRSLDSTAAAVTRIPARINRKITTDGAVSVFQNRNVGASGVAF